MTLCFFAVLYTASFNKHFSLQTNWVPVAEELQMKGLCNEIVMLLISPQANWCYKLLINESFATIVLKQPSSPALNW